MATKAKKTTKAPEPAQAADATLTPQQERFVSEYLIDLNATQAAIRAGYSTKGASVRGSELLAIRKIADAIETGQAVLAKRNELTQDMVIAELRKMAFFDARKLYNADGSVIPITDLPDEVAACITSIDSEIERTGEGSRDLGTVRKVRVTDKLGPLKLLGQHLGLFQKQVTVHGKVQVEDAGLAALSKLTREERKLYGDLLRKLSGASEA